jgi:TRAP transporter TAXI family solute receptor
MTSRSFRLQARELALILGPAIVLVLLAFLLAYQFVEPAPPRHITITTGSESGAYYTYAKRYAAILARSGVTLDVLPSKGSVENLARLEDPKGDVQVALLQGGIGNGAAAPGLMSLGRVYLEPIWLFYRDDHHVERLTDLVGKRVIVGPEGSGTRALAEILFTRSGVTADNATLLPDGSDAVLAALTGDKADAALLVLAPEAPLIQELLHTPGIELMSFTQAEGYARVLPYLQHVTLPRGTADFAHDIPGSDIELLAAQTALVARDSLHPALANLLASAAQEVHSERTLFQRARDFPKAEDPDFPMSADAARAYKQGPSFLKRHLPFWAAAFLERMMVMALPLAGILVPLVRIVPKLYEWRLRQRVLYWYGQLKKLERRYRAAKSPAEVAECRTELDRIDAAVGNIPLPVRFSYDLYSLRGAVELVRNKLGGTVPA